MTDPKPLDDSNCLHCVLTVAVERFLKTHPDYGALAITDICRVIGDMMAHAAYKHPDSQPLISEACDNVADLVERYTREGLREWLSGKPNERSH